MYKIPICVNVVNLYSVQRHNSSYWSPYLHLTEVTLFSRAGLGLCFYCLAYLVTAPPQFCPVSNMRNSSFQSLPLKFPV